MRFPIFALFSYEGTKLSLRSGDNGEEVPPVPIPNTVVKLLSVEDTWWATARENRSSPEQKTTDFSGLFLLLSYILQYLTVLFFLDIMNM